MEVRLTLQKFAEIGSHGFPRVSCYGQYGSQAGNGRKWSKMGCRGYLVGNGFPRVLRHSPTTNESDRIVPIIINRNVFLLNESNQIKSPNKIR